MKVVLVLLSLISTVSALATVPQGIICRDDRRLENGPLHEIILTPTPGGFLLQTQYIPSLNSADLKIEKWADNLPCRLDDKSPLAFCQTTEGLTGVQFKERREVFFDSLEVDAKKKTTRHIDISLSEKGVQQKSLSFLASHCQIFGGDA